MGGGTSIPSWVRVGAKCVCVDDEWELDVPACPLTRVPMLNEVLTVARCEYSEARDHGSFRSAAGVFIAFDEIPEQQGSWGNIGWPVEYFRPLVTRTIEQDISAHFKPLLDHRERERA